jgi:hypothetical protein
MRAARLRSTIASDDPAVTAARDSKPANTN